MCLSRVFIAWAVGVGLRPPPKKGGASSALHAGVNAALTAKSRRPLQDKTRKKT